MIASMRSRPGKRYDSQPGKQYDRQPGKQYDRQPGRRYGSRPGGLRWLLAAGAAVTLVSLIAPTTAPLYDGVGFPDELYRYVTRPAGVTTVTKAATGFNVTVTASDGLSNQQLYGNSAEQGPQVGIYLPAGSLSAAAGVTTFTFQAVPKAPLRQPPNGTIDGNAYALSATSNAGPVTFTAKSATGVVVLRATTGRQPPPVFELLAPGSTKLTALATQRIGNDLYQTQFAGPGEYALAFVAKPASAGGGAPPYGLIAMGVLLLVFMGATIFAVRRTKSTQPGSATPPGASTPTP